MLALGALIALLGLPARESAAQSAAFREHLSVQQVLVPVVVRSGGALVDDLRAEDFVLRVDGRPTAIESFERSSEAPAHVLVLQDLSGSMGTAGRLEQSRTAIARLLASSRSGDLYTIATFAASGVQVAERGRAPGELDAGLITGWQAFGRTGIHDAVAEIPALVSNDSATRGAALLITDGVDNASRLTPRRARTAARLAQVPVHVLALGAAPLPEGGEEAADWSADPLRLLSWVTGGRYHAIPAPAALDEAVDAFLRELRSQYVLGFTTLDEGGARPREIRVEVRGRGRRPSYRREYFGTAPARP